MIGLGEQESDGRLPVPYFPSLFSLDLLETTVADNTASEGGGLALDGATAFIRQSTISGNSATSGVGGGLLIEGSAAAVTVLQSTVTDNDASTNGGGIRVAAGNLLLHNTIVADNSATTANPDIYGSVLSGSSYNLIGDGTGISGISDGESGNQIGTGVSPIDPKLGPLDDNGGPTQTHVLRVDSPALDAASASLALTRLGRSSKVEYDMLGRTVQLSQVDPDGIGTTAAPVTTSTYDANGNVLTVTDPLDNATAYTYDNLGRKTKTTDAEGGETEFTYDAVGRMTSLTDPEDNTTRWTFGPLGRVATETITVSSTDLTRTFRYDAAGNLVRKIDRNERVIDFSYDSLSRKTTEAWYDDVTDADAEQDVRKTYTTTYDRAGRVASVGDGEYDFAYTYSIFGLPTSTTQDLAGLSDDVMFGYSYDALGRKREATTRIGTTDDYVNTYEYDNLSRVTQITQTGVSGGNAVAEKRVDFGYSDDITRATISRFADLAGTKSVADTDRVFDALGRVTDIVHERAATEFADYDLTWNVGSQLTAFDFASLVGNDGDADYTYDDTSQLTDADYDFQTDESYAYDDNGNRTNTGYTTGDHNRLTSDGTYNYAYDDEGNVTSKTNISTSESVEYTWDHRNRLTKVTFKNASGTPTKIVEYAYDHGQRWVRKTLDSNADSTIDESRIFVHDAGQIVLDFEKTGTDDAANSDLSHRYLWGTAVDQILADETVDNGTADDVTWALTDHLNSVRDLVEYNPTTDTTSVIKHVTYDAFGNVASDTASTVDSLLLFTARPYDEDGELQNNLNRWYDLSTGRWMSEDPIGFRGKDVNLYRYVGNSAISFFDPRGLDRTLEKLLAWRLTTDPSVEVEVERGSYFRMKLVLNYDFPSSPVLPAGDFDIEEQIEFVKERAQGRPIVKEGRRGAMRVTQGEPVIMCIGCMLRIQHRWNLAIDVLREDHDEWDNRHVGYDSEWGYPRTNAKEREAVIEHEWDHANTYWKGVWDAVTSAIGPYMEKKYSSKIACRLAASHLIGKVAELDELASEHTESFDTKRWWYGGAYSDHSLDTSNWSVDERLVGPPIRR